MLLAEAGFEFEVVKRDFDESMPENLKRTDLAKHLAWSKSQQCSDLSQDHGVITADTIVVLEDQVLNKPADREEAIAMLQRLSGRKHEVITGVCVRYQRKNLSTATVTEVYFADLPDHVIHHYVDTFKPFDKAGGYGIQEWIGMVGIEKIVGDYYNVVGLPVRDLFYAIDFVVGITGV